MSATVTSGAEAKGWIAGSIRRPVTVSMLVLAVVLFGWVSLDRLALNLLPDISYPSLTVQTDYLDAAPEEVEDVVTRPVEEAVSVVPGLTRVSSTSRAGQSEVVLEFAWKTNMDLAALEVREKLDVVTLPRDIRRPVLLRFDPSNDPVLRLQITGSTSLSRLRYAAERELKKTLESVEGVAAIRVIGGVEEQIRIEIDEKRLGELRIPITQVTRVLGQENLNQASGSLYDLDASYMVRVVNQFRSVEEIRNIVLRDEQGRRVILGDVASVTRGGKDRETITRVNGVESVELAVYKEGDANAVSVARAVLGRLDSMKKANQMPGSVDYQVVFNQAKFIEGAVNDVLSSAVQGGLLATLVLFIFLRDLRSTVVIGLTIPISIMATFAAMYQTGLSLNLMSLGGIALGVGMLVDNSIVVLEAVSRHRTPGRPLADAVYAGASEVGRAVTGSTLTTVAVFVPLIFVEGIAGQLFKDQAMTITFSLVTSLAAALTLIPMLLALGSRASNGLEDEGAATRGGEAAAAAEGWRGRLQGAIRFVAHDVAVTVVTDVRRLTAFLGGWLTRLLSAPLGAFGGGYEAVAGVYPSVLRWSLAHRGLVLLTTLAVAAGAVIIGRELGGELIPPITQGEFVFEVRLPDGRPLAYTDGVMKQIEKRVTADKRIAIAFSSVGGSNKNQFARDLREQHVGQLYVTIRNRTDKIEEAAVIAGVRTVLRDFPEVTYSFSRPTLFSFKTPVEVEIYGDHLPSQREAAEKVIERISKIRGLSDIGSSARLGSPEIQVVFDRDRLARLGLEENEVASVLRNKIRGDIASRYREADKLIEILVRAREADRAKVDDIRNYRIHRAAGGRVAISDPNREAVQQATSDPLAQDNRAASLTESNQANRSAATGSAGGANGNSSSSGPAQAQQQQQQQQAQQAVRLGSVAEIITERGPSEVRRIRSQRAAVVSANLSGRDLRSVSEEIQAALRDISGGLPDNVSVSLGGQNEEFASSFQSLVLALCLAVFLVYLVMACEFESLVHPFLILFTIPLGAVGVVLALAVTGTTLSVMVFLGGIILAGIAVNNGIVLIEYTNQLRAEGRRVGEALVEAGAVRLRPILMTTLTTVLGLIPMALGWGEGAEIRAPMAITVIGGLSISTLLTLVFIPVLYSLVNPDHPARVVAPETPASAPQQASPAPAGD